MSTTGEIFMRREKGPWRSRLDPHLLELLRAARASLEPRGVSEIQPETNPQEEAGRFERKTIENVGNETLAAAKVQRPPENDG